MNIVKEALQKQLDELLNEINSIEKKHDEILVEASQQILDNVNEELFKEFTIKISSTDITFNLGGSSWDSFRIHRRENYSVNKEYQYDKARLSMSSISTDKDTDLKILISAGKLAEHSLKGTPIWIDLVRLMDSRNELYKEDIAEKRKLTWQLENEIRKIERDEQENNFKAVFNRGTFKLKIKTSFQYGSSKWDRVFAEEWFWEKNEGKTYTVSYTDQLRTNSWRDEEGNELEPVYETKKVAINKRVRLADLEWFVKGNIRSLATE